MKDKRNLKGRYGGTFSQNAERIYWNLDIRYTKYDILSLDRASSPHGGLLKENPIPMLYDDVSWFRTFYLSHFTFHHLMG